MAVNTTPLNLVAEKEQLEHWPSCIRVLCGVAERLAVFLNRKHRNKLLGGKTRLALDWIASLRSQRRREPIAVHNPNRRHGEAQRAAAIQMLFGNFV